LHCGALPPSQRQTPIAMLPACLLQPHSCCTCRCSHKQALLLPSVPHTTAPSSRPPARCVAAHARPLQAEVQQRYPARRQVDFLAESEAARNKLASQHQKEYDRCCGDAKYHPAAVAHFAGFWADEQEDGLGDFQYVSPRAVPAVSALLVSCCVVLCCDMLCCGQVCGQVGRAGRRPACELPDWPCCGGPCDTAPAPAPCRCTWVTV